MRTTTKLLLCFALITLGAMLHSCAISGSMVSQAASMPQPQPRYPVPQYAPGLDSSVFIELEDGHCTGFISEDNMHLVTATHCIEGGNAITATTTYRGKRIDNSGTVVANDGNDHVRIRMQHKLEGRPAKMTTMPPPGSPVYLVGNPGEFRFLLRVGHVSGQYLSKDGILFDTLDISMWHGDSGGAVFDQHGNVVGLVYGYSYDYNPYSRQGWMVQLSQPFAFSDFHKGLQ